MKSGDIINTLCVNIVYADNNQYFVKPHQIFDKSDYYYKTYMANTIQSVFNRHNSTDILIDKLFIDLGIVTPEDIPYKLSTALERELVRYKECNPDASGVFQSGNIDVAKKGYALQTEEDIITAFLEYLIHPIKPWHIPSEQHFNVDVLAQKALDVCLSDKKNDFEYFSRLISRISANWFIFKRFSILTNSDSLDKVITKYLSVYSRFPDYLNSTTEITSTVSMRQTLVELYELLKRRTHSFSNNKKKKTKVEFLQFLLYAESEKQQTKSLILETINKQTQKPIHKPIRANLPEDSTTSVKLPEDIITASVNLMEDLTASANLPEDLTASKSLQGDSTASTNLPEVLKVTHSSNKTTLSSNETEQMSATLYEWFEKQIHPLSENKKKQIHTKYLQYPEQTQQDNPAKKYTEDIFELVTKRIVIANAGIILLNPMLVTFFKRLNYLDGKDTFRTERARKRAVHLLQWLTGEKGKHYEHLLYLNKIMCGLHPYFPIDPVFRATKKEKEEARNLLESVINYWPVVQGTSIAGLQETFIRRAGAIESNRTNWILRVESKTVDILLNELPWSISLLAFPWNDYIIQVEWER